VEKFVNTDTFPYPWRIQTAPCTMTVNMEVPCSGQAGS